MTRINSFDGCALTPEDRDIWAMLSVRAPWDTWDSRTPWEFAADADATDARKMFGRMDAQRVGYLNGYDWRNQRKGWFPSDWGCASDECLNPL